MIVRWPLYCLICIIADYQNRHKAVWDMYGKPTPSIIPIRMYCGHYINKCTLQASILQSKGTTTRERALECCLEAQVKGVCVSAVRKVCELEGKKLVVQINRQHNFSHTWYSNWVSRISWHLKSHKFCVVEWHMLLVKIFRVMCDHTLSFACKQSRHQALSIFLYYCPDCPGCQDNLCALSCHLGNLTNNTEIRPK